MWKSSPLLFSLSKKNTTFTLSSSSSPNLSANFLGFNSISESGVSSRGFFNMDLAPEELQFLSITDIVKESISIPRTSPRTFSLLTLTLIFPLSFAILVHSLFTHPLINQLQTTSSQHSWTLLFIYQFIYILFLFAFSLLSTAAVVFTVASIYTSKPVSFSNTLSAIPSVLKRLFVTFLYTTLLMVLYDIAILIVLVVLIVSVDTQSGLLFLFSFLLTVFLFLVVHVYITALWHLASVISVLEPVYGFEAMKKSRELLKGKTRMAFVLVFVYLMMCGSIGGVFGTVVAHGGEDYGILVRVFVGGFLVGVLVLVNLIGLMVQSVFYYVCKSYHHQPIDKSALYDHLGGYLGEYVPLKSSVQMESLEI